MQEMPEEALQLLPCSRAQLEALSQGRAEFTRRFHLEVEPGYLEFPEALAYSLEKMENEASEDAIWWAPRLLVLPHAARVIGLGGYKGPPREGTVEIGYGVAPAYRGRGYATLAAGLLVEQAAAAGITRVLAHTEPQTNASTKVLQKSGFVFAGEVEDPDDGLVWQWQYTVLP